MPWLRILRSKSWTSPATRTWRGRRFSSFEPDVITLDLEMPRMDGLTFLRILNEHHPMPVVVVSALTPQGSAKAMEALAAGAVDVLAKPNGSQTLGEVAHQLAYHVKAAARARLRPRRPETSVTASPPVAESIPPGEFSARRVILIGASTGGVEALRFLLPRLPDGLAAHRRGATYPAQFFPAHGRASERIVPL